MLGQVVDALNTRRVSHQQFHFRFIVCVLIISVNSVSQVLTFSVSILYCITMHIIYCANKFPPISVV